uniref:Uncharacterized protein n=1 Tax=Anguilla anguilla TaxID=7936 RepID=A0A0E9XEP8_ANGAN
MEVGYQNIFRVSCQIDHLSLFLLQPEGGELVVQVSDTDSRGGSRVVFAPNQLNPWDAITVQLIHCRCDISLSFDQTHDLLHPNGP